MPWTLLEETVPLSNVSKIITEVDIPPPLISPLTSPVKPPEKSPSIELFLDEPDTWPQELSNVNCDFSITAVIAGNDEKTSLASLQRTLKKINLRYMEPKYRKCTREGYFGYVLYINQLQPKQLQSTLRKIKSNFISIQDSQLCNFYLKNFIIY